MASSGETSYIYGQVEGGVFSPVKAFDKMSESELVQYNNIQFKRILATRTHVVREALQGILFFLGQQYTEIVAATASSTIPITPPSAGGRVRTVDNRIKPIVRSEHARLTRSRPTGTVLPQGTDPADIRAARAGDDIIQHTYRESELENYIEDATLWSLFGGSSLLNCHWSPQKLSPFDELGDYIFRSLSVFEFGLPQLRVPRLEDQPYIMITKAYDIDEIFERWKVAVDPETIEQTGLFEQQLRNALTYTMLGANVTQNWSSGNRVDFNIPQAIVKETWMKPNSLAPEGLVLLTAGEKVLEISSWPEWCRNRYPFSKIDYIRVPGSAYGQSLTQDLIPIQRRHNRALSIIIEAMNIAAQQGISVPKGTHIRKILGGMQTAYEVPMSAQTPVRELSGPPIGDLPFRELENTQQAFEDIAFRHEVSKGENPSYVRAGTQLDLLKEFDDAASVVAQRTIERAVQRIGNIVLDIAKNEWNIERQILVLGKNSELERQSFINKDTVSLAGQYIVTPGSAWPYSKGEKQNMVLQLLDTQVISPDEALEHLELGTSRALIEKRQVDVRHAQRENMKYEMFSLQQGAGGEVAISQDDIAAMMPQDWHNHAVHITEHNNFRKSAEYEDWPDWKKKWFEAHIKGHEFSVMYQMKGMQAFSDMPLPPSAPIPEDSEVDGSPVEQGVNEGLKEGAKLRAQSELAPEEKKDDTSK